MNLYCGVHASAQKITETTKSLKICYIFSINSIYFKIVRWWAETEASMASEPLWVVHYWMCCWTVASTSNACVRAVFLVSHAKNY